MTDQLRENITKWHEGVTKWLLIGMIGLVAWIAKDKLTDMEYYAASADESLNSLRADVKELKEGQTLMRERIVEITWLQQRITNNAEVIQQLEERVRQLEREKHE